MRQGRLLLVDDDRLDRMAFERSVHDQGLPYRCVYASSLAEARDTLKREVFDVILSDYRLGDGTGFDLLEMRLETPIILITGAGNEEIAVRAMKAGARDYLIKDVDGKYLKFLSVALDRVIKSKKVEDRMQLLSAKASEDAAIIGPSGLREAMRMLDLAVASTSPVFITGETGTGKNRIAQAIHYRSALRDAPFVSINCAAIPDHLFEGELFGYEKGAFTGAVMAKRGLFEQANGGTLLLDELGELPLHLQTKLLGVLDDKKVRRLGSESTRTFDARVITTTNVDIAQVLGKTFRTDLFYRLSVIRIALPALRDRREDIPELCKHLVRTLHDGVEVEFARGEMERLQQYDWPGNVRELRNILERALILHQDEPLQPSKFLNDHAAEGGAPAAAAADRPVGEIATLQQLEEGHIRRTLEHLDGNLTRTARVLGVSVSTMKRKVKEYGLR